ncbi:MAG: ABC transporter permease [Clostridia bacterium]|nr:ABC transporter permease [Clostridia bacterium]
MFSKEMLKLFLEGTAETFYMVLVSTLAAYLIGLPLGVVLVVSEKDGIRPMPVLNRILGILINLLRSAPFLILLVALTPVTRAIVGTSLGSTATIVPLVIGSAPFIARMVESSIKEVDAGVIEAAQSMGASPMQIVMRVMLPEAKPSLTVGAAIAITTILGYSAMAGFVGGGGLGTIAVNYGVYRYQTDVMLFTLALLVLIVQAFQEVGMRIANRIDKRKK